MCQHSAGQHGAHNHSHAPADYGRAFAIGVALNAAFVVGEVVYGLQAHSLALVADAGHNLSDVGGLLLSWGAFVLARRGASARFTYGLRRASILSALFNALLLFVGLGGVAWEAAHRFAHAEPVAGKIVMAVSAVGILVNTTVALLFMRGREHDLNIKSAFSHMAADAVISLGVLIAGAVILFTHWLWLDPAVSLVIVGVILWGTWSLFKDALALSLDAVPNGIDPAAVRVYLETAPGVSGVHDLHIWAVSTTEAALTAHLAVPAGSDWHAVTERVSGELHDKFGIEHATLQLEPAGTMHDCPLQAA